MLGLLEPDGAMLLQAITIDDRAYEVEKASKSFINTRIFPGGCLPSLEVIARHLARKTDLQEVDLEDITAHYVPTLRSWRENFTAKAAELAGFGYDERFHRLWTLYLAYCEAGFAERRICDVQLLLAKPRWRPAGEGSRCGPRPYCSRAASSREARLGSLPDALLDRTVVGSYTRLGYALRSSHWDDAELRRMDGKVVIVTGATSGLGEAAAAGFARLGATVWRSCATRSAASTRGSAR